MFVCVCTEPLCSVILKLLSCAATAKQCCANRRVGVHVSLRAALSEERVTDLVCLCFCFAFLSRREWQLVLIS